MKYTYTALDLKKYYRTDTTLRPSKISREEALRHLPRPHLHTLEARAAKYGTATMNTLSDHLVRVTAVAL